MEKDALELDILEFTLMLATTTNGSWTECWSLVDTVPNILFKTVHHSFLLSYIGKGSMNNEKCELSTLRMK